MLNSKERIIEMQYYQKYPIHNSELSDSYY